MRKKKIEVLEDENWILVLNTEDPGLAEQALREMENVWYGDDESKWDGEFEKRTPFTEFSACTVYKRGEHMSFAKDELPVGRGRIAEIQGFCCPIN